MLKGLIILVVRLLDSPRTVCVLAHSMCTWVSIDAHIHKLSVRIEHTVILKRAWHFSRVKADSALVSYLTRNKMKCV